MSPQEQLESLKKLIHKFEIDLNSEHHNNQERAKIGLNIFSEFIVSPDGYMKYAANHFLGLLEEDLKNNFLS
jgi:hypothetical protein